MSLKILNVAETTKGGVATYLSSLASGESTLGVEFFHLFPERDKDEACMPRVYYHASRRSAWGIFTLARNMIRNARRLDADVIFAHSTFAGFAMALARPFLGRQRCYIYCPHGWAHFRRMPLWKRHIVRCMERLLSYVPDATINISRSEHESVLAEGFSRKCRLITNTVLDYPPDHIVRMPERDDGILHVLFVGRFDEQKGVDILFDVIRSMKGVASIHFDIVGGYVLGASEPGVGTALPRQANLTFHGWLSGQSLLRRYEACDVLVMPSRWEGFGLCALEAYRTGRPVIASRTGGLVDIVDDNVTGILFDGSAKTLMQILEGLDKRRLAEMGIAARRRYEEKFYPTDFFTSYRSLFQGLAGCRELPSEVSS